MMPLPRIRTGLLRHSLDDQVLVYDSRDDRVHLLDPTTACVLELLEEDGSTSDGIALKLSERLGVAPNSGFLPLAIEELRRADLLDQAVTPASPMPELTRRDLLKKIGATGAAAFLIPAVATLTATPGYAQSSDLLPQCAQCTTGSQCQAGSCGSGNACGGEKDFTGHSCTEGAKCCSGVCSGLVCT